MSSPARQTANAANAQRSTGPQTDQGKARSSQNARKHGLTAAELVIAAEDRQEFDDLHAGLQTDIQPRGALQETLFDELVASAWHLRRLRRMEAELTASAESYTAILDNPDLIAKLDRLARHKTRIERSFHRSLHELKAMQTDAALTPTLPANFMDIAPPLASRTQIAKRTQALVVGDAQTGLGSLWRGYDAEASAVQFAMDMSADPKTMTA
jgi:DNA gyrase/topoisomerase IV subunit A